MQCIIKRTSCKDIYTKSFLLHEHLDEWVPIKACKPCIMSTASRRHFSLGEETAFIYKKANPEDDGLKSRLYHGMTALDYDQEGESFSLCSSISVAD